MLLKRYKLGLIYSKRAATFLACVKLSTETTQYLADTRNFSLWLKFEHHLWEGSAERRYAHECCVSVRLGLLFSLIGHEPQPNEDSALVTNQGPAFASFIGGAENPA